MKTLDEQLAELKEYKFKGYEMVQALIAALEKSREQTKVFCENELASYYRDEDIPEMLTKHYGYLDEVLAEILNRRLNKSE